MAKDQILKDMKLGIVTPEEAVRQFDAITPKMKSGAALNTRTYTPKSKDVRIQQYAKDKELRALALRNRIPFINERIGDDFHIAPGFVLIGGVSGRGKSTTAANLLSGFLNNNKNKNVVVISNEESGGDILNRVACLELKCSFFEYQNNRMSKAKEREIEDLAKMLTDRIEIVDDDAWDMSTMEDTQAVMEYSAESPNVGMIIVDYWQTVAFSKTDPNLRPVDVHKIMGLYVKDYSRRVGIPTIVFAQLRAAEDETNSDMKERVENDRTIYNHAVQAIEIVPDFDALQTKFVVHKDRFGYKQGRIIETMFVNGRYEPIGESL